MKRILALLLTLGVLLSFSVTSAHAITETSGFSIIGDADGDQYIEIRDATFIQRYLLNIELPFVLDESAADADEDGTVTILDVTNLQRWLIDSGKRLNIGDHVIPWFDKTAAYPMEGYYTSTLTIYRICQTHFYALDDYNGNFMRINGDLPDQYCVNDTLGFTIDNVWQNSEYPQLIEGDLLFIYPMDNPDPYICYKPVIYLYPEEETEVDVQLDIDGSFLYTLPEYSDGWKVIASPDGTLTAENGKTYPYLFWEANLNTEYDFTEGFCVKGSDTEAFLQEALTALGLNENEKDEFIDFWLRYMQNNPYNVISFQTSAYTEAAKLNITPLPDTTIRVFMAWYASDKAIDIPEQTLESTPRNGFTAVEWGGQMCR